MSKNQRDIPATELVERAQTMARIVSTNDEVRAGGALNDVYLQDLPSQADWQFLLVSSAVTTDAKYTTGTVAVDSGATAVTFTGATLPTALDGGRLKFNDNPNVYTFTRSSSSNGTIAPALSEDKNISGGAFVLVQPVYTLAENFLRFPKNGGLQSWQGGRPTPIPEAAIQDHYTTFTASPARPTYCRLVEADSIGRQRIELGPPPDKVYLLPYDYFFSPPPLRETTGGVTTVAASGTGATFQGAVRMTEMVTGMFFRVDAFGDDADSEWHRIVAVSAANSNVTFQSTFTTSAANSANYTVCSVPILPLVLQGALLHGLTKRLLADQNDRTFLYADSLQTAAIHDAKRLYKTRTYNQHIETSLEDFQFRR